MSNGTDPFAFARAQNDDLLLALIAEERRLRDTGSCLQDRAMLIEQGLPEDIRRGPRVIFRSRYGDAIPKPEDRIRDTAYHFRTEGELSRWLDQMARTWGTRFNETRQAELIAEYRVDKVRVDAALEAAGCAALEREGNELVDRADELFDQIEQIIPLTLSGAIALFEIVAEASKDDLLNNAVAGLRSITTKGATA